MAHLTAVTKCTPKNDLADRAAATAQSANLRPLSGLPGYASIWGDQYSTARRTIILDECGACMKPCRFLLGLNALNFVFPTSSSTLMPWVCTQIKNFMGFYGNIWAE
ncbi:MAG: hypothetical protein EBW38_12470 [Rhodobacteraceae bacterium]|nr:hypothetical protein [Paracoccaceae bacterium]